MCVRKDVLVQCVCDVCLTTDVMYMLISTACSLVSYTKHICVYIICTHHISSRPIGVVRCSIEAFIASNEYYSTCKIGMHVSAVFRNFFKGGQD